MSQDLVENAGRWVHKQLDSCSERIVAKDSQPVWKAYWFGFSASLKVLVFQVTCDLYLSVICRQGQAVGTSGDKIKNVFWPIMAEFRQQSTIQYE